MVTRKQCPTCGTDPIEVRELREERWNVVAHRNQAINRAEAAEKKLAVAVEALEKISPEDVTEIGCFSADKKKQCWFVAREALDQIKKKRGSDGKG